MPGTYIDNSGRACMRYPATNLHVEEMKCLNSYLLQLCARLTGGATIPGRAQISFVSTSFSTTVCPFG